MPYLPVDRAHGGKDCRDTVPFLWHQLPDRIYNYHEDHQTIQRLRGKSLILTKMKQQLAYNKIIQVPWGPSSSSELLKLVILSFNKDWRQRLAVSEAQTHTVTEPTRTKTRAYKSPITLSGEGLVKVLWLWSRVWTLCVLFQNYSLTHLTVRMPFSRDPTVASNSLEYSHWDTDGLPSSGACAGTSQFQQGKSSPECLAIKPVWIIQNTWTVFFLTPPQKAELQIKHLSSKL